MKRKSPSKPPPDTAAPTASAGESASWLRRPWWGLSLVLVLVAGLLVVWAVARERASATCGVEVVQAYPHDPGAYTQGLAFDGGDLFEGTGKYG